MFILNSLNMPSPILPLKAEFLIQEEILSKTSKKKKKGEAAALFLKSLRTPELPFKLQPRAPEWGARPPVPTGVTLAWPWSPGWPRLSGHGPLQLHGILIVFDLHPLPGSPTAQWHHQVRPVSKSKERTLNRNTGNVTKDSAIFYTQEKHSSFSPFEFTACGVRPFGEEKGVLSLPFLESANPRKDSETKVGISFKRWLLSRCTSNHS